jgi:hypothetical protein
VDVKVTDVPQSFSRQFGTGAFCIDATWRNERLQGKLVNFAIFERCDQVQKGSIIDDQIALLDQVGKNVYIL